MFEKLSEDAPPEGRLQSFLSASGRDLSLAERMVEEALLAGAEEAEIYLKTSATTGIYLQGGFATLAGGHERGLALRVFDGRGNFSHAFSSWTQPEVGARMIRSAMAALRSVTGDPVTPAFPAPCPAAPFPEIEGVLDGAVVETDPAAKRALLERALAAASRQAVAKILVSYRDGASRVVLANSRGLKAVFTRTLTLLTLTRSEEGGPTLHGEVASCHLHPDEITESTDRLLRLDRSGPEEVIPTSCLLLESAAATDIVRWIEHELVTSRASPPEVEGFRRIASEAVEVVDDPLLPGGVASSPFDGEGFASVPLRLVKSGIRLARFDQVPENGPAGTRHSVRSSYRDLPAPGGTNLIILPGRRHRDEMLQSLDRGFLLAALECDARGGQRDEATLWRGIGWEVRDGLLTRRCRRVLFRAAPRQLLEGILEVSRDVRCSLRRATALGCPDLLIRPQD